MKRALLFILSILILITAELNASLYDGCMGYYSFNNNWIDACPSDQTAAPSESLTFVEGQKGQGIYLDGMDDYISLGVSNFVDHLTISFWIKLPHQPENWQAIISRYDETNSDQPMLKHTFYIKVLGKTFENQLYFAVSEDGQKPYDIFSDTTMEKQKWYHVVAMFQPGKLVLYLNGQKEKEKQIPIQQLFTSAVPVIVGSMMVQGKVEKPFANAVLDELRLYNRNISEAEILSLYEKKSGPRVLYHEPNGISDHAVSYIDIHFNVPILSKLLTNNDLKLFATDQQTITVNMPEQISETVYRFSFDTQETNGIYRLQVGPDIYDYAGNALDQDQDSINGESEDIYAGEYQLNAQPDSVLLVNLNGSAYDANARNIYKTLLQTDADVIYFNLDSSDQEESLLIRLTQPNTEYQQVWVYDKSTQDGKYSKAIDTISAWFLLKQDRQIICDGRIRASFRSDNYKTIGKELTANYYVNLKLNGGGLLLATDHPDNHPDINAICEQIGISDFGTMTTYHSVKIDRACHLMSYPNQLEENLESSYQASMVPTGKQSNGSHLYCVAWDPENYNNCNISTTLIPFMPTDLTAQVNGTTIELSWKTAQPEKNVAYYNVYLSQEPFSSISDIQPYTTGVKNTHFTISSLEPGQRYYMATTAVNQFDNERQYVMSVSATTKFSRQNTGGDGGGCFLMVLEQLISKDPLSGNNE
jgi:hypothetical protein